MHLRIRFRMWHSSVMDDLFQPERIVIQEVETLVLLLVWSSVSEVVEIISVDSAADSADLSVEVGAVSVTAAGVFAELAALVAAASAVVPPAAAQTAFYVVEAAVAVVVLVVERESVAV
jgi:hypothetical protein